MRVCALTINSGYFDWVIIILYILYAYTYTYTPINYVAKVVQRNTIYIVIFLFSYN